MHAVHLNRMEGEELATVDVCNCFQQFYCKENKKNGTVVGGQNNVKTFHSWTIKEHVCLMMRNISGREIILVKKTENA